MVKCKQNLVVLLKDNGYSSYRLRKDKIMGTERIQRLRHGELPSWRELDIICKLTGAKVEEVIEYVPDDEPP